MTRRRVLLALAFALTAGAAHAEDALIIRDGTRRKGVVAGCREDACTLDGAKVARGLIAWVGLRQADAAPPEPRDPLKDEVHLLDGRVVAGEFGGLSLGVVAIDDSSFDRDEVAWIRFAGPVAASPSPAAGGPTYRFSPSPPAGSPRPSSPPYSSPLPPSPPSSSPRPSSPPSSSPRPPSPPSSSPPPPSPPSSSPPAPSPRPSSSPPPPGSPSCDPRQGMVRGSGVMWTGTARVRQSMRGPGFVHEDTADFEVKLRESCEAAVFDTSVTPRRRIGTVVYLDSGGTVQSDTRREEQTGSCLCEGRRTHTAPSRQGGEIWRRTGAGDTSRSLGFDLPSQPFYWLGITSDTEIIEAPCRGEYCVGTSSRSLLHLNAGRHPLTPPAEGWDPELRSPEGGIMSGSWTKLVGPATLSASWSICRQGVRCPPPPADPDDTGTVPTPPPPRGPDPCADADARQATLMRSMRTASEMVAFAERDLTCAQQRRDEAFGGQFGASGPYAQFFAALGAFAAEFQPGAGGDFFGLLFALTAMAQEPGRESIDDTALEIATTDYFQALGRDSNVRSALLEMEREFARTGDARAAIAGYRARLAEINVGAEMAGKGLKCFTAGLAWKSLWDKMSKVCDSWSLEQAWQRALWDAENERSAADQRWNEGDVELQTLRRSCPGLVPPSIPPFEQPPWNCPVTPNGDTVAGCGIGVMSSSRGPAAPTVLFAAFAPPVPPPATTPADPTATVLVQAAEALRRGEARLDTMVPLLLLFSRDLGVKVSRPLLAEAASAAAREGEAARADALRAVELARQVEPALRAPRKSR